MVCCNASLLKPRQLLPHPSPSEQLPPCFKVVNKKRTRGFCTKQFTTNIVVVAKVGPSSEKMHACSQLCLYRWKFLGIEPCRFGSFMAHSSFLYKCFHGPSRLQVWMSIHTEIIVFFKPWELSTSLAYFAYFL